MCSKFSDDLTKDTGVSIFSTIIYVVIELLQLSEGLDNLGAWNMLTFQFFKFGVSLRLDFYKMKKLVSIFL